MDNATLSRLVLIDGDIRTRDDRLYNALPVLAFPSTRRVERSNSLVEREPAHS
jgi:hypothetical protein